MLSLKLVRSLVLGESIINHSLLPPKSSHHEQGHDDANSHHKGIRRSSSSKSNSNIEKSIRSKSPVLLFIPTKELVTDTYRLASIARDIGMDLYPTPSLSHIVFSFPSASPSPPLSSSSSASASASASSSSAAAMPPSWSSSSSSWSLPNDAVPLPFPSLATAPLSHLRLFVSLSKGLFKLGFLLNSTTTSSGTSEGTVGNPSNWDCCSISLFSRLTGDRIETMDAFSRALAGMGWTLYKTKQKPSSESGYRRFPGGNLVYLFRKVDLNRVRARQSDVDCAASGESRIRELRLPPLDFRNAPLRILQYIRLMTDDIFYLA